MTQRVHAFTDDALGDLDATGVAEAIAKGSISSTEAVHAAITRCELLNPTLEGLVRDDYERARARSTCGRPGGFAGVPSALKDNLKVEGMPMREGSKAFPQTRAKKDGAITRQILSTGIIPIGTTSMPEFGWTGSTESFTLTTRNPWDTTVSAGGSSGGAGALVAAGVVPFAHGNDGAGSVRIPASACGLVGLKPTRGRLRTSETARTLPVRIVSDSMLTRSVRDTARFFAEAEKDFKNKMLPAIGLVDRPIGRPLRIGLMLDSAFAPKTDPQVRARVEELAGLLESLGHSVEPYDMKVPGTFVTDFMDYWSLLAYLAKDFGKQNFGKGFDATKLEPLSHELAKRGKASLRRAPLYIARLLASSYTSRQAYKRGPEVLLTPTLSGVTPALGVLGPHVDPAVHIQRLFDHIGFTPLANATGCPAMSLPAGLDDRGIPVGAMISATHGNERTLLELALQIEAARPFDRIQDLAGEAAGRPASTT